MNNNTIAINGADFTLDAESKSVFWTKVNEEITKATKNAGFDPTSLLKYSDGEYFIKADDLICWLKIVFPNSDIQLRKVVFDDTKCQYICEIWRTPETTRPTVAEGSLVYRNDNGQPYQWKDNYVSSAETMAIIRCIKLLGIGSQCKDEYYVEKVNSTPTQPASAGGKLTIETASNCVLSYVPEYKGEKKYESEKLGDIKAKDIRFFREIALKTCFTPEAKECANFLLKFNQR